MAAVTNADWRSSTSTSTTTKGCGFRGDPTSSFAPCDSRFGVGDMATSICSASAAAQHPSDPISGCKFSSCCRGNKARPADKAEGDRAVNSCGGATFDEVIEVELKKRSTKLDLWSVER